MSEKVILPAEDMGRALVRIAHEIVEHNKGYRDIVFVGLLTRGVPLAKRLAKTIALHGEFEIPVGTLDISLYRDDLSTASLHHQVRRTEIPVSVNDKNIVLIDDVLYTGRSIRAAMDAIIDLGRPKTIQLAVLIDRGHRELPIRPDYVGKNVPTSIAEEVLVRLAETDSRDEVVIISREEGAK